MKRSGSKLRLFIIECPDPKDLLQGRSESDGLEKICKLIGHEVTTFQVRSKNELSTICNFISTITSSHSRKHGRELPLCIHIVAHGNDDGLGCGKDLIYWKDLFRIFHPICNEMDYAGDTIFIISACGAGKQKLTNEFEKEWKKNVEFIPPHYLFVTMDEEVYWDDALVSWAMFYHQLPKVNLNRKIGIQDILDRIKQSNVGNIQYHRWDEKKQKYLRYRPE